MAGSKIHGFFPAKKAQDACRAVVWGTTARKSNTLDIICMYRSRHHGGSAASSLFTATTNCCTPSPRNNITCSLVCPHDIPLATSLPPPLENPASNLPVIAATTSIPQSALEVPAIVLGTKPLCPGASNIMKSNQGVRIFFVATSMVNPRSRLVSSLSANHARAKEGFPTCALDV